MFYPRLSFAIVAVCCLLAPPLTNALRADPTSSGQTFDWDRAQSLLDTYCMDCHTGDGAEGNLDLTRFHDVAAVTGASPLWTRLAQRVRDGEMPPKDSDVPAMADRLAFVSWIETTLRSAACGDGVAPGGATVRRLNRSEYGATLRDLLNIHIDVGQTLPADGAGGEGFDNAAETLFMSPLHAEKYMEAAHVAVTYALRDPNARRRILVAAPTADRSPEQAAQAVLDAFLPRTFRRPLNADEQAAYLRTFQSALEQQQDFEAALQVVLEAALVSPHFLFRAEPPNEAPEPRLLDDYSLASRLSYFLWNSMPDDELLEVASQGRLQDPTVLSQQVLRMLGGDERSESERRGRRRRGREAEKVRDFAQSFVEQWLGTRALGREFKPDPAIAARYDAELEGGMKYEPVLFFQELLNENLSLLNLLDSEFTYANRRLARHYEIPGEFREQPRHTELPSDSPRGGLLGMSAVLAVSSYPHRTSPVLRGKWIMETMLGTPAPPPPPNVPPLDEATDAKTPQTLRARLEEHRQHAACASCHDRIDPLGFGLENFDVLGNWRTQDAGQPIDARGQLPDGTTFDGPDELKQVLLARKDQFIRHLTAKMLGYALGRGLTTEDYCSVDAIVEQLRANDYAAHTLILGITQSIPFRYQAGTDPTRQLPWVPRAATMEQSTTETPDSAVPPDQSATSPR